MCWENAGRVELYDELPFELDGGDLAVDVDLALVVFIQLIDPKAILLCIDNREELIAKTYELRGIDEALENRGLDSLAVVLADAGYLAEAFSSGGCRRGDIVGDEDIHLELRPLGIRDTHPSLLVSVLLRGGLGYKGAGLGASSP